MNLSSKHVFITGASAGLGAALAQKFAAAGANLTICARRVEKLAQLKEELLAQHPLLKINVCSCDVSQKDSMRQAIEDSIKIFGGLDVFVANAGQSMWSRFRDIDDPDELLKLMQLNYMGLTYGLYFSLPHLKKSHGSFMAISSIQGVLPVPFHAGYVASKYAVNGLIETVRLEEPDIHFLLAMPSWIAGTELRSHAVSGKGDRAIKVKTHHSKKTITKEDCAGLMVDALISKKSELFIPSKYRFVPVLRGLFRNLIDKIIMAKVAKQIKD